MLLDEALADIADRQNGRKLRRSARIKRFRASLAWKRVRYRVLAENAARNGGKPKCELCGSTESPLHVDHIRAVSRDWDARFRPDNLQVLCAACNVGKLDGPPRDFRPHAATDGAG